MKKTTYNSKGKKGKQDINFMLGAMCFLTGLYKDAFTLFSKSVKQGNIEACHQLGAMYYVGKGVKKNHKKAFKLYLKAAEQGHVFAQNMLGIMYYKGQGTKKSNEKAFCWLSKSAKHGNKYAKIYLKKYKLNKNCKQ